METNSLKGNEKLAYGLGAIGKDMMYMFSATYVSIYFLDIMGVNALAIAFLLMAARVFDAFNDPFMGVLVAKTKTRWGQFRPWLFIGTITNAIVLYFMFTMPPTLDAKGMVVYASVSYILWGMTYTMMDIPYWSMIPAFTKAGKEREGLAAFARSMAGVGSVLVAVVTPLIVGKLGYMFGALNNDEADRIGYGKVALIIAVIFVVFVTITCVTIKEKSNVEMKTSTFKEMIDALVKNDQAMTVVVAIVMINIALYTTQQLVYFFLKYDFSPATYSSDFALFNAVGGAFQILSMIVLFPLFRKFMDTVRMFYICFGMAAVGYIMIIAISLSGINSIYLFLVPAALIMSSVGVLNVIITIFLANTVDYGELKNMARDESVIFSMQTFVVKLASGVAGFLASMVLYVFHISKDKTAEVVEPISMTSKMGLRLSMTLIPMAVLFVGYIVFKKHFVLTDEKMNQITKELDDRKASL